jgi:hypothetical protein
MAKFDFSKKQLSIADDHGHSVTLSLQEAVELLEWLSDKRAMLPPPSPQQDKDQRRKIREQMEIHLQQQHLVHLDALKDAIPQLHESPSATSIFLAPADSVTERAIQLLEAYRIAYKIHPLLEDDNAFAQG